MLSIMRKRLIPDMYGEISVYQKKVLKKGRIPNEIGELRVR
jgi:hypothetical protein